MSRKKNVVYWLGAGASAKALPVVGEMPSHLRNQVTSIRNLLQHYTEEHERLVHYDKKLKWLAQMSEQYGTVDTYARSLYLLDKHDELAELKLHLSMYFLLEQALERKDYSLPAYGVTGPFQSKKERIDTRYMTWLAQLIETKGQLDGRVRIVSWNYDLQLEHAMALYGDFNDMSQIHDPQYSWVYPHLTIEEVRNRPPSIIHLNGIAGQGIANGQGRCLYTGLPSKHCKTFIRDLLNQYGDYDKREQYFLHLTQDSFTFAWEDKPVAKHGKQYAKEAMMAADVLVIIGYSFPAFNRRIDLDLIRSFIQHGSVAEKRIVVQSPRITAQTFRHFFQNETSGLDNITVETDVSQFYLPPELFS